MTVSGRPASVFERDSDPRRGGVGAPIDYPLPCGSVHRRYVCALTWQYPSDQAARPCWQRREGSEGGRAWILPNTAFIAPTCRTHGRFSPPEPCCKEVYLVEGRDRIPNVGDIRLNLLETRIPSAYGAPDSIQWAPTGYRCGSRRLW